MGEKGIGKSINNVCYTDWGDSYALEIKLKCKSWKSVSKNKDPIQLFFTGIYEGGLQEQLLTNSAFSSRSSPAQTGEVNNWISGDVVRIIDTEIFAKQMLPIPLTTIKDLHKSLCTISFWALCLLNVPSGIS